MNTDHNPHVLLEELAEGLVMVDVSDPEEAKNLAHTFEQLAELIRDEFPRSAEAAASGAALLTQENDPGGEAGVEEDLAALVSGLQEVMVHGDSDADVQFPGRTEEKGAAGEADAGSWRPPGVDDEIFSAYIAQQISMLSDLEECILSYERQRTDQTLAEIKRLVHTAKGEAGVMGLSAISDTCHTLEDYIQAWGKAISPDALLAFKDWFQLSVEACQSDGPLPDAGEVIRELSATADPEPAPQSEMDPGHGKDSEAGVAAVDDDPLLEAVHISDPEITGEFITEAQEHFDIADENLLLLEIDPQNLEAVAAVFRAFHTIKGTCGFLGLTPLSELAHKAENLLDEVRKERLNFAGQVVDATFNALDMLKSMTAQLQEALSDGVDFVPEPGLRDVLDFVNAVKSSAQEEAKAPSADSPADLASGPEQPSAGSDPSAAGPGRPKQASEPAGRSDPAPGPQVSKNGGKTQVKQTMKIDADKIDLLLDTIGELVIVESIVTQDESLKKTDSPRLERNLSQLTKITRSLQDMGMSMRMIPIETTFRRMARLVRDLAKKAGKRVELEMYGKETELDKAMVEKLGDPLVHMVRNAVDHGVEPTPEDRVAAGKPAQATVTLKAYHEGGSIHIAISDDGRGLNREVIGAKAVERGIISSVDGMSDEEIYSLIFEPGFSTAAQITDVSGRGVGMDVVKNNIESLRGNIRIHSTPGQGTTFTLVLPLTMAIIDGMLVRVGSERYILPLLSIIQSFRPTSDMLATVAGRGETLPFRGRLVPMFRLSRLFDVQGAMTDPTEGIAVVVEDAGKMVALLVDELLGQNQTVIKTLGSAMGSIQGVAGASIMSDGSPGLIIDVNGVVRMATTPGGQSN